MAFIIVVIALGAWWYLASARKTYRYMTQAVDREGTLGIENEIFFELNAQKYPRLHKINRWSFLVFMVGLGPFRWIVHRLILVVTAVIILPFWLVQKFWEFMTDFVSNAVPALRQPRASLAAVNSKITSSS